MLWAWDERHPNRRIRSKSAQACLLELFLQLLDLGLEVPLPSQALLHLEKGSLNPQQALFQGPDS